MKSPIPNTDGALLPWLQNFCVKFPLHAVVLGVPIGQIAIAVSDCNMLIYLLQTYVPVARNDGAEAVRYKELIKNGPIGTPGGAPPAATPMPAAPTTVPPGALPRLRLLVQEIKNKAAYNEAMGTDLGIIAAAPEANTDAPVLTLITSQAGNVVMAWTKNGWTGVKLQGRMQGAASWTDLGLDLFSPFADTRPLQAAATPEVREYRACHMDGDTPLLNWSAVLVVTVQP